MPILNPSPGAATAYRTGYLHGLRKQQRIDAVKAFGINSSHYFKGYDDALAAAQNDAAQPPQSGISPNAPVATLGDNNTTGIKYSQGQYEAMKKEKVTPWEVLEFLAQEVHGEFGFPTLSEEQMAEYIYIRMADKIADREFGVLGFASLSERQMKKLIDANPDLLRGVAKKMLHDPAKMVREAKTGIDEDCKVVHFSGKVFKAGDTLFDAHGNDHTITGWSSTQVHTDRGSFSPAILETQIVSATYVQERYTKKTKMTPWIILTLLARKMNEPDFESLSNDDAGKIIDLSQANKLSFRKFGNPHFMTLSSAKMQELVDNNTHLLVGKAKDVLRDPTELDEEVMINPIQLNSSVYTNYSDWKSSVKLSHPTKKIIFKGKMEGAKTIVVAGVEGEDAIYGIWDDKIEIGQIINEEAKMEFKNYPILVKALVMMAYDNGVINRSLTKETVINRTNRAFKSLPITNIQLKRANDELEHFSKDELLEICGGDEDSELNRSLSKSTSDVLTAIFNTL
jgi:hypothetical protein